LQDGATLFDLQCKAAACPAGRKNRYLGFEDRQIMVVSQDIRQPVRVIATTLQFRGSKLPCDVDLIEKVLHLLSPFVQARVGCFVLYTSKCPSTGLIDPSEPLADGDFVEPHPRDFTDPFLHGLQGSSGRHEVLG
jgi:hypothetical protein